MIMLTAKHSFKITHSGQLQKDAVVILIDHLILYKLLNLKNMQKEGVLKPPSTLSRYGSI